MEATSPSISRPSLRSELQQCAAANGHTSANALPHVLPQAVLPRCAPQKWLLGQKALVTGASSGIGRAIAIALGEAGARARDERLLTEQPLLRCAAGQHGLR